MDEMVADPLVPARARSVFFAEGIDQESDAGACGECEGTEGDGEDAESGEECVDRNVGIFHARSGDREDHVNFGEDEAADGAVTNEVIGGMGGHGASGKRVWVSASARGWRGGI